MSRCWAPSVHWLSMSSAVICTDWASQLSNKELSNGKDFDKPAGRARDATSLMKAKAEDAERGAISAQAEH